MHCHFALYVKKLCPTEHAFRPCKILLRRVNVQNVHTLPRMHLSHDKWTHIPVAECVCCRASRSHCRAHTRCSPSQMCEARLRPVLGRHLIPSPYGGMVLVADMSYCHLCLLVDLLCLETEPVHRHAGR
jgi:hypothetical protein